MFRLMIKSGGHLLLLICDPIHSRPWYKLQMTMLTAIIKAYGNNLLLIWTNKWKFHDSNHIIIWFVPLDISAGLEYQSKQIRFNTRQLSVVLPITILLYEMLSNLVSCTVYWTPPHPYLLCVNNYCTLSWSVNDIATHNWSVTTIHWVKCDLPYFTG